MAIDINKLADWSPARIVETKKGTRLLRVADPSTAPFGTDLKSIVKSHPELSWGKTKAGDWELLWWQKDEGIEEETRKTTITDDDISDLPF